MAFSLRLKRGFGVLFDDFSFRTVVQAIVPDTETSCITIESRRQLWKLYEAIESSSVATHHSKSIVLLQKLPNKKIISCLLPDTAAFRVHSFNSLTQ